MKISALIIPDILVCFNSLNLAYPNSKKKCNAMFPPLNTWKVTREAQTSSKKLPIKMAAPGITRAKYKII